MIGILSALIGLLIGLVVGYVFGWLYPPDRFKTEVEKKTVVAQPKRQD